MNCQPSRKHLLLQLREALHGKPTHRPSMGQYPGQFARRHPKQRRIRRIRNQLYFWTLAASYRSVKLVTR